MMLKCWASLIAVFFYIQLCTAQTYVAEGYFVVDKKALDKYINAIPGTASYDTKKQQAKDAMRKDIGYTLSEANRLLSSLASEGIRVEVRQRDLKFLDTDIFSPSALQDGYIIGTSTGLSNFGDWLNSQNAYSTLKYDFAVLWTGYDLSGSSGIYTAGVAHTGKVCDEEDALSLVEFDGTYHTALVTAHEIAHLLGSSHDGAASQRVMASVSDPKNTERWAFSGCSASDILELMETLQPNCLLNTNSNSVKSTTTWLTYSGQLFDPDVICQRALNDTRSYMCMSNNLYGDQMPKGDAVCQTIYCRIPDTSFCKLSFASEGMVCDKSKRCSSGKCQPDTSSTSASVDASCVFGDQKTLSFPSIEFYGTCQEHIDQYGTVACYNDVISSLCCATCNRLNTGRTGCEFGDRSSQCVNFPKGSVCPTYGSDLCCGYCEGYVGKRSTNEDMHYEAVVLEDDLETKTHLDESVSKAEFRTRGNRGDEED